MKTVCGLKEPFCAWSHGAGVLLSAGALSVLLLASAGKPLHTFAFAVYGLSLMTLYAASTLYHAVQAPPRVEALLQRFDHCAIYLLIAGSYTPVCLLALRNETGAALLGIVWGLAIVGIASRLWWRSEPGWLRVTLYVIMGWLVVLALAPLSSVLPPSAMSWLFAGGVAYSVGMVIFAIDRPHLWPGKFSAHDLRHLFVLAGSACHFVMMARFVAPLPLVA